MHQSDVISQQSWQCVKSFISQGPTKLIPHGMHSFSCVNGFGGLVFAKLYNEHTISSALFFSCCAVKLPNRHWKKAQGPLSVHVLAHFSTAFR